MVLFTNLTPVNKQIEMAQYIIDGHKIFVKEKVIGIAKRPLGGVTIKLESGFNWTIHGQLAEDLLKIK